MKKFLIALFLMFIVTSAYAIPPMPGGGGGVIISTDCSTYIALGQLCQDTDDGKLYKGTGAAVVEIAAGSSGDMATSMYDADSNGHVDDAELLKVKSVAGYLQAVGVSAGATREKTVRDANDTLLELGGSYTPTGTWNFTSLIGTWPTFNQNTTGTAAALTSNGANCAAGQLPLGVDASGAAEGCTATPSLQALTLTGANTLSLGTASTNTGSAIFKNATNANAFTITSGVSGADIGWTLPTAAPGGTNYLLNVDADGTMGYTDPASIGGGTGTVDTTGTPAVHQWALFTDENTLEAKAVTGSKVVCTDSDGEPTACTNLTDVAFSSYITKATATAKGVFTASAANTPTLTELGAVTNGIFGVVGGTFGFYTTMQLDDSAAQFKHADASQTFKIDLQYLTAGDTPSLAPVGNYVFKYTLTGATDITFPTTGTLVSSGVATGGIVLGDDSPDADGELGFANHQLSIHDNGASRDVLQVASTTITKSELLPIRYAEDDDSVTAPAAVAEIGTTSMVARSFAEDADNGVVFFWHVPLDYSAGIKYRVYYAIDTNAGADETAVFGLSGCSVGNLDAIACTEGTAVNVTDELTADYDTGELIVTDWSSEVTVTDITAGEMAKLLLIRDVSEDDMVGHALIAFIEIKYQAKVNASGDY